MHFFGFFFGWLGGLFLFEICGRMTGLAKKVPIVFQKHSLPDDLAAAVGRAIGALSSWQKSCHAFTFQAGLATKPLGGCLKSFYVM